MSPRFPIAYDHIGGAMRKRNEIASAAIWFSGLQMRFARDQTTRENSDKFKAFFFSQRSLDFQERGKSEKV
jgi:hypothetical protein